MQKLSKKSYTIGGAKFDQTEKVKGLVPYHYVHLN